MRLALGLSAVWLLAPSCGYGDSTPKQAVSAAAACEATCARIESLRCPDPLPSSIVTACRDECAAYQEAERYAECEAPLLEYFECLDRFDNIRCSGPSFEWIDDCAIRRDLANACLAGSSGLCPAEAPVDCNNGFCCPSTHPVCVPGGMCARMLNAPDAGVGEGGAGGGG